jgi:hypothetical protein
VDVATILEHIDAHGFEDVEEDIKVDVIYDVITEFIGLADWPWLDAEVSDSLASGDSDVPLPNDFLRPVSFVIPSLGVTLRPERMERINKAYPASLTESGPPSFYYPVADAIKVFPVPDKAYEFTMQYKRQQPALTASSEESDILIPKRHHRGIIVQGAVAALYASEDDPENEGVFQRRYERRTQLATADLWRTQNDRPDYVEDVDALFEGPWW